MGTFGLSYVGLAYLVALWVPNVIWARQHPAWHDPSGEKRVLLVFERIGQMLCTAAILIFRDTNPHGLEPWLGWFAASVLLMILYLLFWVRYFTGPRTKDDFYRPLLGVPLPGATLPVAAFLLLGIFGKLIWLIAAAVILGIGHIGIHLGHLRQTALPRPANPTAEQPPTDGRSARAKRARTTKLRIDEP